MDGIITFYTISSKLYNVILTSFTFYARYKIIIACVKYLDETILFLFYLILKHFFLGKIFGKNLTHNLKTRICPSFLSTFPKPQLDVPQDVPFVSDGKFSILHNELVNVLTFYSRIQV